MEVCFELVLPAIPKNNGCDFKEELVEWGGEKLRQDPPRYTWKDCVSFTKRSVPGHIARYLPGDIDISSWEYLSLNENILNAWERVVNDKDSEEKTVPPLKEFLSQVLVNLDEWILVFELNGDQIDNVYQFDPFELIAKIEKVLDWKNEPEGFIAWCKSDRSA